MAHAWIGTSGWMYKGWRQHLYADTPIKRWLQVASRAFGALEVNGSFYGQISEATYTRFRSETPDGFKFVVKGHRFITHFKRLRDCSESIARLKGPASALGDRLGAVIWQLPAQFSCDLGRLDDFLGALTAGWPETRHALEMRDRSWFTDAVASRLAAARVANVLSDAPDFPMWREVTTDLVYVRLHGHTRKYASSYSAASLATWAAEIGQWLAEGRDVHVYLDNDAEGAAVHNARDLMELLGIETPSLAITLAEAQSRARAKPTDSQGRALATPLPKRARDRVAVASSASWPGATPAAAPRSRRARPAAAR